MGASGYITTTEVQGPPDREPQEDGKSIIGTYGPTVGRYVLTIFLLNV